MNPRAHNSAPSGAAEWLRTLQASLDERGQKHLLRELQPLESDGPTLSIAGKTYLQFASNNYLGLAQHPEVIEASRDASTRWGTGAGASRLVTGSLTIHHELEKELAAFKHAEAALLFPTGFMANLAVLTTFAGEGDLIVSDKLNHASLLEAARYSGAEHRTFPHLRYERAGELLGREALKRRRFLVTDSVFSMDGDVADLPAACAAAEAAGAIMVLDEAHGTGVLGGRGSGLTELQAVEGRVPLTVGTLSKALGSLGGFVTGPRLAIETLVNDGRSFIYTTALPPACAAAALAALRITVRESSHRVHVLALAEHVRRELKALGYNCGNSSTPIIPVILGEPEKALQAAAYLREQGLFVPAIRPPTVPPNAARLRLNLMATHTDAHIERLLKAMHQMRDAAL